MGLRISDIHNLKLKNIELSLPPEGGYSCISKRLRQIVLQLFPLVIRRMSYVELRIQKERSLSDLSVTLRKTTNHKAIQSLTQFNNLVILVPKERLKSSMKWLLFTINISRNYIVKR